MNKTDLILEYFSQIIQIPRPSGSEEKIRTHLIAWAVENGYSYTVDPTGNLIVDCPACRDFETCAPMILQSHMDMVCIAEKGVPYDPDTDPIHLVFDGEYLRAAGTSLGGDDGIGIALSQYLAEHCNARGPLRLIFTVNEEETTEGAVNLSAEYLDAPFLINLDSEVSDKIMVSSAGCIEITGARDLTWEPSRLEHGFSIKITGLTGGHSGDDIDKNRANALILMGILIQRLDKAAHAGQLRWELSHLSGGHACNAIPNTVLLRGNTDDFDLLCAIASQTEAALSGTYSGEKGFHFLVESISTQTSICNHEAISRFLAHVPDGLLAWSPSVKGLVGTSSNLGIFHVSQDECTFDILVRGEYEADILQVSREIETLSTQTGFRVELSELTPSWPAQTDSTLLKLATQAYQNITGQGIEPIAVHAVLECAEFRRKNDHIEMISISPDVYDVHSPSERIYIPSIEKIANMLEELFKLAHLSQQ